MSITSNEYPNEMKSILTLEELQETVKCQEKPKNIVVSYLSIGVFLLTGIGLLFVATPVGIIFTVCAIGLIILEIKMKKATTCFINAVDLGEFTIRTISVIKTQEESSPEGPDYLIFYSNGRKDYVEFDAYKSAIIGETFFVVEVPELKLSSRALFSTSKYELDNELALKLVND